MLFIIKISYLKMRLIFLCILFANNVMADKKLTHRFTVSELKQYLRTQPKLWETRELNEEELNYYKHRSGAIVPRFGEEEELLKKESHIQHIQQSRLSFDNVRNHLADQEIDKITEFDARTHEPWSRCDSIREIQHQTHCQNCWAVASAAVMSDRACIATNGENRPRISAIDLTRCCVNCHLPNHKGDGCQRGEVLKAFNHYAMNGIVTGGSFGSSHGCQAYPFLAEAKQQAEKSGACKKECDKKEMSYNKDRRFGKLNQKRWFHGETEMKREIYKNGPLVAHIILYDDFMHYSVTSHVKKNSHSIYYNKVQSNVGTHAVRVLGWGETDGLPYWIVANSWGHGWGDNGIFLIMRGVNMSGIEEWPVAGTYDRVRSGDRIK